MGNLSPVVNCDGCASLNGVFHASYVLLDSEDPDDTCYFHLNMGVDPCDDCEITSMDLWVTLICNDFTGEFRVIIEFMNDAPNSPNQAGSGDCVNVAFWGVGQNGPPPDFCTGLGTGAFFLVAQTGCDGSSATVKLEFD